ncbi:MAG: T9SS type A sorting domain-containing protein [Cryomorphaceae bacterium]
MKSLFLLHAFLICTVLNAQGDYQLTHFTANYVEITGGESWGEADWDDPEIDIPMEFNFVFGQNEVTNLIQIGYGAEWGTISANGIDFISYGGDVISSAEADNPGAPSTISWVTEGNPGNRILKIQYKDVGFYAEVFGGGTAENRVNFQMWFYELGSAVEFRFGPSNVTTPLVAYEGLSGPPIYFAGGFDGNNGNVDFGAQLIGDPASPQLSGIDNIYDFFDDLYEDGIGGLNSTPAEGQVYRLLAQSVSVTDHEEHSFELYPTIAQQEVFLRGDLPIGMPYRIVSLSGAAVVGGVLSANSIDVSGLASGMYLLQIDGTSTAQKFVKR